MAGRSPSRASRSSTPTLRARSTTIGCSSMWLPFMPDSDARAGQRSRYRLADKAVWRVGYGAMQLAGDGVFGPPRDRDEAIAVLRAAVAAGVNHLDTAQYYGPGTVN